MVILISIIANKQIAWIKTFNGDEVGSARSLIQTTDGGYAEAGYTRSYGASSADFLFIKIELLSLSSLVKVVFGILF